MRKKPAPHDLITFLTRPHTGSCAVDRAVTKNGFDSRCLLRLHMWACLYTGVSDDPLHHAKGGWDET